MSTAAGLVEAAQRSVSYRMFRVAFGWGVVAVTFLGLSSWLVPSMDRDGGVGGRRAESVVKPSPTRPQREDASDAGVARRTTRFSLTVLAAEDAIPVADARLLVEWWDGDQSRKLPVLQTVTHGVVEFNVPKLPFDVMQLWVSADGRVPKIVEWHGYEVPEGTTRYTLKLARGTQLSGSVQNEAGDPVADATISFSGPGLNMAERENIHFHRNLSAVTSNEQGRWSMNQMPGDKGFQISASHPDYAASSIGAWTPPGMPTNVIIVLTNGFPVNGQVLAADGRPVPGAMVCKQSGAGRCTKTDEEGRFTWSRIEPGKVWLNVRADGFNELNQTRLQLMTLIRTLHHRHRQVLLLRYYSGLKLREIAALLNLPYSNVYARLESACGKLCRLLYCDSRWGWLQKEFRDQFPPLKDSWERSPHMTARNWT